MSSAVNEEQVRNLKALFNEGFDEFVLLYFKEFEKKDKELSLVVGTNYIDKVRTLAHALKGNSINMGATALAEKCTALEQACLNNKENIEPLYKELQTLYPSVKQSYLDFVSTL